jgi:hypothetical protein
MTHGGLNGMHSIRSTSRLAAWALAAGLTLACGDDPFGPGARGSLTVRFATTGGDVDLDGYTLTVDGIPQGAPVNGTLRLERLPRGPRSVGLGGMAPNCAVDGDNPRTVTVVAGATVEVAFVVQCVATAVWVAVTTTGLDLPTTSYDIVMDGGQSVTVPVNSSASIGRLTAGDHSVALNGLSANCTVSGPNPVTVTVPSGKTVAVTFNVSCGATTASVAVIAATSGFDLPQGDYTLRVDAGVDDAGSVPVNGSTVIDGLAAGDHMVELAGVPPSCTVSGDNPATVIVSTGGIVRDTAEVAFEVSCVYSASIAVTATTTGFDRGREHYTVGVDGAQAGSVPPGGSAVIDGFLAGDHTVELADLPSNCVVPGANPVTVTVTTGGMGRDTAEVAFDIDCAKVWEFAFTRILPQVCVPAVECEPGGPAVHTAPADGSDPAEFARGEEADWSPDGTQLAFGGCDRYYYDYYYGTYCEAGGLRVASTESDVVTALTSDLSDTGPSWRPDGSKIAFTRGRRLFLIDPDGSAVGQVPVPQQVTAATDPDWSPDGTTLAFTCEVESGNTDICLVRPDGSGFLRLTSDPGREARPAWKPDGSSIAFAATTVGGTTEIGLVSPDGSQLASLSPGIGAMHPAWSPDGARLAFLGVACNLYSGCRTVGLFNMNADGTGVTQLTDGPDSAPAWRP